MESTFSTVKLFGKHSCNTILDQTRTDVSRKDLTWHGQSRPDQRGLFSSQTFAQFTLGLLCLYPRNPCKIWNHLNGSIGFRLWWTTWCPTQWGVPTARGHDKKHDDRNTCWSQNDKKWPMLISASYHDPYLHCHRLHVNPSCSLLLGQPVHHCCNQVVFFVLD